MAEECPGKGKCHGSMRWCDRCGDVAWVCDDPECDCHNERLLGYHDDEPGECAKGKRRLKNHLATLGTYLLPHERLFRRWVNGTGG